jgi:hypothetical protein
MDPNVLANAQKVIESRMNLSTTVVVLNTGVNTKGHSGNITIKTE